MAIRDQTIDVLIGGYMSKEAAVEDYEAVLACGAHLDGAVVISKSLSGELEVEQTDHLVRKGAEGLGAVGFAVGLFAPPLLAATAVGAAMGAAVGKVAQHKVSSTFEDSAGETIPLGGAGLIVAYPKASAEQVDAAVGRAVSKVVGEANGSHVKALKGAIADAQRQLTETED